MLASSYPRLLADVGGTNVRFALIRAANGPISDIVSYRNAEFESLLAAALHYLTHIKISPRWAAFGVATAIAGDEISMTNIGWTFTRSGLQAALGVNELLILNDFTALALSLSTLTDEEVEKIGGGEKNPDLPIALIGAGTGLGVSGLIPVHRPGETPRWVPIQGEGGHVSFSPFNRTEDDILHFLRRELGHVSAERLLSGMGIVNIHRALAAINELPVAEELTAADITSRGVAGTCELCTEVVETFCGMLGTAAANLAVTLGARGGVYIGGGIVPKLGAYFATSPFRRRFEQKGRFSNYLAAVPSYVIHADNPALRGAAAALDDLLIRKT